MNMDTFIQQLEGIPPLELEAMQLLPVLRAQSGEWFPAQFAPDDREKVIAATLELVSYTRRCAEMTRRLSHLKAMPLEIPLLEFGL